MSILTPDETILGLLVQAPQHGYQLLAYFRDPSQLGSIWDMSTSQVYAVLKRLEKQAWIVGHELEMDNAPTRTVYVLTPDGHAQLIRWLHQEHLSASIRRIRVEFLSRLYIARRLGLPTEALMARQRQACDRELVRLREQRLHLSDIGVLSLELGIAQLEAVVRWIERCEVP